MIPSRDFVDAILELKGDKIFSMVLFASMAKGNYTKCSDYDLLIIVSQEELSFKDRLYAYSRPSDGWVEPLVYTREEAEAILEGLYPLILNSIKDGVVIYDKGLWGRLKSRFDESLESGAVTPKKMGWIISARRGKRLNEALRNFSK